MRSSRGGVAALWALFASVAIVSGWIAVHMVGSAITPAAIPVLTVGEVSQRLATSSPTDDPTPLPKPSHTKGKKSPTTTSSPAKSTSTASSNTASSSTSSPRPSPTATSTGTKPSGPTVVRTLVSRGGSVVAACRSGRVTFRSWSPAVGYRVDEVDPGPGRELEVRFVGRNSEVKMQVKCISGVPTAHSEYDSDSGDDD